MAKSKTCIIIFTEGETEEEFYNLLLEEIKRKNNIHKFSVDKLERRCLKGISKFDKKLLNIYKNDIKVRYYDYKVVVFFML